nr:U-box domain-containing protein 2-like isoform X3 [Ipomoea trifida]
MRKFLRSPFVWSRRPNERRIVTGGVEISLLNSLFLLSSLENLNSELVRKYYREAEDVLKILKPILNAIVHTQIASDRLLQNVFSELGRAIDELMELFETCQPWSSKIYFVLQVESLIAKVQSCSLKILQLLISSYRCLPGESSLRLLEHCVLEIKSMDYELLSTTISETIKDQVECSGASSDSLEKIADRLCLKSNQDLLIEILALEKLKENSEQDEKSEEVEHIEQIIVLVTHMREALVMMKQSENSTSVSIPADFCCPLSLELMRNPVTVASGQTYEWACIRKWIVLGLRVCPNTRQTLAHTNLIPNCSLKAQITDWCETNSVKLPVPVKALSLSQPSFVVLHGESCAPIDNHIVSTSWDCNYGSPESSCSSRRVSISSSAILREAASPSQSCLSSEESFCGAAIYGLRLDVETTSLKSSVGGLQKSEDRSINSVSYYSMQLSMNSVSSTVESFLRGHSQTAYATPDSVHSLGSPTSYPSPYASQRETYSQSLVCSASDASLSRVGSYGLGVDVDMVSLNGSEDWMAYSSYGSMNSIKYSMWLSMNNAPSVDGGSHLSHNRTTSASSTLSNLKLSRVTSGVASGSYTASTLSTSRGEFGFPSPLKERPCPPSLWHRLFERFNPRIVSSTVPETMAGLSEVEKEVRKLVVDLKMTSIDLRRNAAAELQLQAKHSMENQIMLRLSGASNLVHKVQENAVTALLKLSNYDNNKYTIVSAGAVEPLIDVLETGSRVAKKNSAATLFTLSVIEENKIKIGRSGVITALVNFLGNGTPRGKKNAAKALFNLSILHKNKASMVQAGAVKHLIKLMQPADRMVDKAVAILSKLATIHDGRISIDQEGGIPVLVNVVKIGSARSKEYAAAALNQLCFDTTSLSIDMDNKVKIAKLGAIKPLVDLLKNGTSRGKKDAASALFSLSLIDENKAQILHAGAVKYLIELLDPALWMADDAVAFLYNLATIHKGRTAIVQEGGIPVMVEVVNSGSARAKENAAATLLLLCTNSNSLRNIILHEGAIPSLEALLQSGNTRAREKAEAVLSYLKQDNEKASG